MENNSNFCSKCGTSAGKNQPDLLFGISLIASIAFIWLIAFNHTNVLGMTYIDWLAADCDSSSSSSTGIQEWDEILDDLDQDLSELCFERQGEGFIIISLLFTSILFAVVLAPKKKHIAPKNSHIASGRAVINSPWVKHERVRRISANYDERLKIIDNIESYVKKMIELGYDEEAAREHAVQYYEQQSKKP